MMTALATTLSFDEAPLLQEDAVATAPAPAKELASKFWYGFDRWLAVTSDQAEEEFVFA